MSRSDCQPNAGPVVFICLCCYSFYRPRKVWKVRHYQTRIFPSSKFIKNICIFLFKASFFCVKLWKNTKMVASMHYCKPRIHVFKLSLSYQILKYTSFKKIKPINYKLQFLCLNSALSFPKVLFQR